jgi:hypothetical protein
MPSSEGIYKKLLDEGFTKKEIRSAIYKTIMHIIEEKKAYEKLSFFGKMKWHIRRYIVRIKYFFYTSGRKKPRRFIMGRIIYNALQ